MVRILIFALLAFLIQSCASVNALYFEDGKRNELKGYVAAASNMSYSAVIDTVNKNIAVDFDKAKFQPCLHLGVKSHLAKRFGVSAGLYFPYIVGGVGGFAGLKYTLTPKNSLFSVSVVPTTNFSFSRDSIKFKGQKIGVNTLKTFYWNFGLQMPVTISPTSRIDITISPQLFYNYYRFNQLYPSSVLSIIKNTNFWYYGVNGNVRIGSILGALGLTYNSYSVYPMLTVGVGLQIKL